MKRIGLISILLVFTSVLFAQDSLKNSKAKQLPQAYIGIGAGINNYCGLIGIGANFYLVDDICLRVGAGIGTWGSKLTAGVKYEKRDEKGWGCGISLSSCSGGVEQNLTNKNKQTHTIVNLLRVNTINLTGTYSWVFHNKNRFYIETGYSIGVTDKYYEEKNGRELSDFQTRFVHLMKPGGIIIGIGFLFGL